MPDFNAIELSDLVNAILATRYGGEAHAAMDQAIRFFELADQNGSGRVNIDDLSAVMRMPSNYLVHTIFMALNH